jgi:hypothetical protein
MWSSRSLNQLRYPEIMGYTYIVEEKRGLTAATVTSALIKDMHFTGLSEDKWGIM